MILAGLTLGVMVASAGSNLFAACYPYRNCNGAADSEAARREAQACTRAEGWERRIENDRQRQQELERHRREIEALKRIEDANRRLRTFGNPSSSGVGR
jgi:hypothetical protein